MGASFANAEDIQQLDLNNAQLEFPVRLGLTQYGNIGLAHHKAPNGFSEHLNFSKADVQLSSPEPELLKVSFPKVQAVEYRNKVTGELIDTFIFREVLVRSDEKTIERILSLNSGSLFSTDYIDPKTMTDVIGVFENKGVYEAAKFYAENSVPMRIVRPTQIHINLLVEEIFESRDQKINRPSAVIGFVGDNIVGQTQTARNVYANEALRSSAINEFFSASDPVVEKYLAVVQEINRVTNEVEARGWRFGRDPWSLGEKGEGKASPLVLFQKPILCRDIFSN